MVLTQHFIYLINNNNNNNNNFPSFVMGIFDWPITKNQALDSPKINKLQSPSLDCLYWLQEYNLGQRIWDIK
jgi:hypothetical protein